MNINSNSSPNPHLNPTRDVIENKRQDTDWGRVQASSLAGLLDND